MSPNTDLLVDVTEVCNHGVITVERESRPRKGVKTKPLANRCQLIKIHRENLLVLCRLSLCHCFFVRDLSRRIPHRAFYPRACKRPGKFTEEGGVETTRLAVVLDERRHSNLAVVQPSKTQSPLILLKTTGERGMARERKGDRCLAQMGRISIVPPRSKCKSKETPPPFVLVLI